MSIDPISAGFDLINVALNKFFPDADMELKGKLAQAAQEINNSFQLQLEQIKTNQVEATSSSVFVSGWRPAIGWISVAGLSWTYVVYPVASFVIALLDSSIELPKLASENLLELIFGMLGLGAMRSYERIKGVIPQGR